MSRITRSDKRVGKTEEELDQSLKISEKRERIENCLRMFAMKVLSKRIISESDIEECLRMIDLALEDKTND